MNGKSYSERILDEVLHGHHRRDALPCQTLRHASKEVIRLCEGTLTSVQNDQAYGAIAERDGQVIPTDVARLAALVLEKKRPFSTIGIEGTVPYEVQDVTRLAVVEASAQCIQGWGLEAFDLYNAGLLKPSQRSPDPFQFLFSIQLLVSSRAGDYD